MAAPHFDGLTRAAPSAHGVDPRHLLTFLDEAQALDIELHGLMAWKGGDVIAEGWWAPYGPERPRMMHSATKSFLSAGIGLAVEEGRFALDDRVIDFFPDHLPAVIDEHLAALTVEDLLTQTSGHAHGTSGSVWRSIPTSWIAEFFKIPVVHEPGSTFMYSSATSFMLSAILTRVTGQSAHDYLKPRLFDPLGMTIDWDVGPEGINPGGNGISARTADLLKLAVLHLRGGVWNGRRILPEAWVRAATSPKRGNAHGYHWWTGDSGSFHAYGVFGQFAFIWPEHDAVLVTTAAAPKGERALRDLVAHHFLRALAKAEAGPDPAAEQALRTRCAGLRLPELTPSTISPRAAQVSGVNFKAEPNEDGVIAMRVDFSPGRCAFHLRDARGDHVIEIGLAGAIEAETTVSGFALHHGYEPDRMRVAAAGRWSDPETFEMSWRFVETAFCDRVVLHFSGGTVTLERGVNVNSSAVRRPTVTAHRAAAFDSFSPPSALSRS